MLDGRWRAKVERGLEPVGQGLHRVGISADGLTVIGLVIAVATAFAIADGHIARFGTTCHGCPLAEQCTTSQDGRTIHIGPYEAQLTRDELIRFFDGRVAKWWIPDDVVFLEQLPHTATGKLLKTKLREDYKEHKLPTA
jgi:acyl-CoA synthetase (AMP-forming)/AMP-acid ligase II